MGVKITALPASDALTGAEQFETVQSGVSKRALLSQVYTYVTTGLSDFITNLVNTTVAAALAAISTIGADVVFTGDVVTVEGDQVVEGDLTIDGIVQFKQRIVAYAGTNLVVDKTYAGAIIATTAATAVALAIRQNDGDPDLDWETGDFFSVHQEGAGQVTVNAENVGELGAGYVRCPAALSQATRERYTTIALVCRDASLDAWWISGDLDAA